MKYGVKYIALIFILFSESIKPSVQDLDRFSLLSWNILGLSAGDVHTFFKIQLDERFNRIIETINSYDSDIVCLQEVNNSTLGRLLSGDRLERKLNSDYHLGTFYRKGPTGGVAVLYKKTKFNLISEVGAELPDGIKGNVGSGACACLQSRITKKLFLISSIHISRGNERNSGRSPISETDSGKGQLAVFFQIINHFKYNLFGLSNASIPLIISGDFNTLYEEMVSIVLPWLSFFNLYRHNSFTSNNSLGYMGSIDHILYEKINLLYEKSFVGRPDRPYTSDKISDLTKKVLLEEVFGKDHNLAFIHSIFPSDHLPIFAVFESIEEPIQTFVTLADQTQRYQYGNDRFAAISSASAQGQQPRTIGHGNASFLPVPKQPVAVKNNSRVMPADQTQGYQYGNDRFAAISSASAQGQQPRITGHGKASFLPVAKQPVAKQNNSRKNSRFHAASRSFKPKASNTVLYPYPDIFNADSLMLNNLNQEINPNEEIN